MVGDRLTSDVRDRPDGSAESASDTADVVPQPRPSGDYGVFWLDLHGRITRWSDEAAEVFGHGHEEADGLTLHDLFTESDRAAGAPARALEAARDHGAWDGIGWRLTRRGESFWGATSLTMVYTPNGLGIGVMAVVRRLETNLAAEVIDSDAKRLASLGRVASEVSHDVRNILSAIRGFAAVLERRLPDGDAAHQVWHELVKACDRGADLTERVLGVARTDDPGLGPVCLVDTVTSLEPMLRQIVPPRIRLEMDVPEAVSPIVAQRHDIELAVLNVVVNARDAISGPGLIGISVTEEKSEGSGDSWVVLSVRDTGDGMSPDIQDRIFDRFFTTKASGRGTGLGMAMVRDSVRAAGGSIEVESAQGAGSVIRMLFDATPTIEAVDRDRGSHGGVGANFRRVAGASPTVRTQGASDRRSSTRHTVLVWCGSPVLRAAAADLLGRRGYGVRVAHDDGMAERILLDPEVVVDCVVVDAGADLSSTSGVGPARKDDDKAGPPVVRLANGAQEGLPADRILVMPLDPRVLCEAVQRLASEYEERRASVH